MLKAKSRQPLDDQVRDQRATPLHPLVMSPTLLHLLVSHLISQTQNKPDRKESESVLPTPSRHKMRLPTSRTTSDRRGVCTPSQLEIVQRAVSKHMQRDWPNTLSSHTVPVAQTLTHHRDPAECATARQAVSDDCSRTVRVSLICKLSSSVMMPINSFYQCLPGYVR